MANPQEQFYIVPSAHPAGEMLSPVLTQVSERRRWVVLLAVALVTAVEVSNRISVNVILPDMQGNVTANSDQISWVLTLYNSGFICSMALSAGMRRWLGARHHFLISIALYAAGALGCFLSAHSLALLLVSRVIMGFGGGAFIVRFVVLTAAFFPGPRSRRPLTYALFILFGMQIIYPMIMGALDDAIHWNYAFLIDSPFLFLGAYVIWKYMPPGHLFEPSHQTGFDYRGTVFLIVSMFTLQSALSRGEQDMWLESSWIAAALGLGVLFLIFFVIWELHPRNDVPVLHLRRVLESNSLRASFGLVMVLGALMGTVLFILPQYLRNVQSFSASQTGVFFGLYASGLFVGGMVAIRVLLPRFGGFVTLVVGFSVLLISLVVSIDLFTPDTPTTTLVAIVAVQGFAIAPMWFGVSNVTVGQVALPRLSEADATYYFVRQLGNSFGVTFASVVFDRRLSFHSSRLLDTANRLDPTTTRYLKAFAATVARNAGGGNQPVLGSLQIFQQLIGVQSRLLAFVDIAYCLAALSALGILLGILMRANLRRVLHQIHVW